MQYWLWTFSLRRGVYVWQEKNGGRVCIRQPLFTTMKSHSHGAYISIPLWIAVFTCMGMRRCFPSGGSPIADNGTQLLIPTWHLWGVLSSDRTQSTFVAMHPYAGKHSLPNLYTLMSYACRRMTPHSMNCGFLFSPPRRHSWNGQSDINEWLYHTCVNAWV